MNENIETTGVHDPPPSLSKLQAAFNQRLAMQDPHGWAVLTNRHEFVYLPAELFQSILQFRERQRSEEVIPVRRDPVPAEADRRLLLASGFEGWSLYHERTHARSSLASEAAAELYRRLTTEYDIRPTGLGRRRNKSGKLRAHPRPGATDELAS